MKKDTILCLRIVCLLLVINERILKCNVLKWYINLFKVRGKKDSPLRDLYPIKRTTRKVLLEQITYTYIYMIIYLYHFQRITQDKGYVTE